MRTHTHNQSGRRGFTLIELLVVITIIALMMGLLFAGLRAVFRGAQAVADEQAARSISMAMTQFENDNGFRVPLVFDGNPLTLDSPPPMPALLDKAIGDGILAPYGGSYNNLPAVQSRLGKELASMAVYSDQRDLDFFRGGELSNGDDVITTTFGSANSITSDIRYSKFALPIYLSGVLDRDFDGLNGPGITKPARDGSFAGVTGAGSREPIDAYVDPTVDFVTIGQAYADDLEVQEHHGAGAGGLTRGRQFARPFLDRYERAFRYYRWEPGRNSRDAGSITDADYGVTRNASDLNIPIVLADMLLYGQQAGAIPGMPDGVTDRKQIDVTGGDAGLRDARWAIVGAGPDGFFGTEPMSVLDIAGTAQNEADVARIRAEAQEDNVVITGR